MRGLKQYETCQRKNLLKLREQINRLHADMGGRDSRPERVALSKCMDILTKELDRPREQVLHYT
jgi:hypothetical protein